MRFLVFIAILLSACTTIEEQRGAELRDVKTSQISPDSSKADVAKLLGSPSTISSYGQETWYYINSHKQRSLYGRDDILKQEILAITFDQSGMVQNMEVFDKDDARDFAFSDERTPTAGRELGVIEQLLGNVGRFNTDETGSRRSRF